MQDLEAVDPREIRGGGMDELPVLPTPELQEDMYATAEGLDQHHPVGTFTPGDLKMYSASFVGVIAARVCLTIDGRINGVACSAADWSDSRRHLLRSC